MCAMAKPASHRRHASWRIARQLVSGGEICLPLCPLAVLIKIDESHGGNVDVVYLYCEKQRCGVRGRNHTVCRTHDGAELWYRREAQSAVYLRCCISRQIRRPLMQCRVLFCGAQKDVTLWARRLACLRHTGALTRRDPRAELPRPLAPPLPRCPHALPRLRSLHIPQGLLPNN
jgi:hypothetical protein